ncbi:MAG: hypothetical protein ABIS47_03850 [Acidimicrobiales bacterium]
MCGFADGEAAAAAYRAGFPHAPADEHLTDYLDQIADSATAG